MCKQDFLDAVDRIVGGLYETQILEFIDMEHTPKNLLIRAVKKGSMRPKHSTDIRTVEELLHVAPTLDKLLNNK